MLAGGIHVGPGRDHTDLACVQSDVLGPDELLLDFTLGPRVSDPEATAGEAEVLGEHAYHQYDDHRLRPREGASGD